MFEEDTCSLKRKRGEQEHSSDLNKTVVPNSEIGLPFAKTLTIWKEYIERSTFEDHTVLPSVHCLRYLKSYVIGLR